MTILFAALIFGIAVLVILLISMIRSRIKGKSKLVDFFKVLIMIESAVFIAVFIFVIIRTMAM